MATTAFPLRFDTPDQKRQAMTDAALHGMSLNAYVLSRLGFDKDPIAIKARAGALAVSERLADSPEFDDLDAQFAAMPRTRSAELGFDPAAYAATDAETTAA
jgi:hypothetical protein